MLTKNSDDFYRSSLLTDVPGLWHAFSTRKLGDTLNVNARSHIASLLSIDSIVWQEQTHGNTVRIVNHDNRGSIIKADGIVTTAAGLFLTVHIADCVPILLVDAQARVVAAVHAGWRGCLAGIAARAVDIMQSLGAKPSYIQAAFGPHIGMCCYDVPSQRAKAFLDTYENDTAIASVIEGAWHLSLAAVNFLQLTRAGLLPKNIDAHPVCTSCRVNEFFSYRKDSTETFGEIMGVIGFRN